jgi:hypothetical protein
LSVDDDNSIRKIPGSHGSDYEDDCLLECCVSCSLINTGQVSEVLTTSIVRAIIASVTSETSVNFSETTGRNILEDIFEIQLFIFMLMQQPNTNYRRIGLLTNKNNNNNNNTGKAVPLHAMEALGGRGDIAPTHSRPRH